MCKIYDSGLMGYPVYTVTRSGANLCIISELHGRDLKYEVADVDGALIKTIADDIQQVNQWLNPTELEDLLGKYGFDLEDITHVFDLTGAKPNDTRVKVWITYHYLPNSVCLCANGYVTNGEVVKECAEQFDASEPHIFPTYEIAQIWVNLNILNRAIRATEYQEPDVFYIKD